MTRRQCAILFVGCAGIGLSGCVAAVIPLAASGVIGHSTLRHHKRLAPARPEPAAPAPATSVAATASVRSIPSDRPATQASQAYSVNPVAPTDRAVASSGTLPARPAVPVAAATTDPVGRSPTMIWSDVMRFAAAASLEKPQASALLAKGSTSAAPHWLSCRDKPVAVLVNLPAAGPTTFFDGALENLRAIETMGVALLFMSDQPASVVARQRAVLKAGNIAAPVTGTTLFMGRADTGSTTRATIGGQYCVAAVVGSRAGDFPNATLPGGVGASPGWFLIR